MVTKVKVININSLIHLFLFVYSFDFNILLRSLMNVININANNVGFKTDTIFFVLSFSLYLYK